MLPLSPSKLGRYEIVEEIGKGAMGVVYLARDPLIGRLVALKTFRISYSFKDAELEQFRARFIREAQSAGILSHPNIVTIHDVVERGEEGLAFIAMEYVRGTNLKSVLQEPQRPTLTFACEILTQIADGLDYAHSCKVIHRDIKPANILITADNRAKITDFGIARLDTSNLTQEGQLLGTPNYMSPEQILGRDVDHRADIFSLGVVLYEMVTRHKPFQGENLTVVSHRIVYDQFTPLREYTDDLPPGTEQILAKALEKDPGRRYQRARDMADDLRRVLGSVGARDTLNETQSLSTTAMLPAHLLQTGSPALRSGSSAASLRVSPPAAAPSTPVAAALPAAVPGGALAPSPAAPALPALPPTSAMPPIGAVTAVNGPAALPARGATPDDLLLPGGPLPAGAIHPASPLPPVSLLSPHSPIAPLEPLPEPSSAMNAPAAAAVRRSLWRRLSRRHGGARRGAGEVHAFPPASLPGASGGAWVGTSEGSPRSALPPLALATAAAVPMADEQAEPSEVPGAVAEPHLHPHPRPLRAPPPPPASGPDAAATPAPAQGVYPHSTRPMVAPPELASAGAAAAAAGQPVTDSASWPASPPEGTEANAMLAAESLPAARPPGAAWRPRQLTLPLPARLAVAAAAGLGLVLLLAGGVALRQRSQQPPARQGTPARPEASQGTRLQVLGLVRDGRHRLESGDADGAVAAFRAAEQLLPGRRALRQLREEAEHQQNDRRRRIDQERMIGAKLDEGRLALADRRYPEAEAAAQAVLVMSPGNTVAEEILKSVKEGRARTRDRAVLAGAREAARTLAAAASPVRPDAAPANNQPAQSAAAEVKDATLELAFFSELPEGSLLVYVNGQKVLQKAFRFYEKGGLFRSHPTTGWVRQSFRVPAGDAVIRLYVTPHGSAAVVRNLNGNFPGGASRRLDVKLTDGGDVTTQLN